MAAKGSVVCYRVGHCDDTSLQEDLAFDLAQFNAYLQVYMTVTRLRLIRHEHPEEMPAPAMWDMYPSQSISGSR